MFRLLQNENCCYLVSHEATLRSSERVITRENVWRKLSEFGLTPTPKRSEAEIIKNFQAASKIGREWLRTIDGETIPSEQQQPWYRGSKSLITILNAILREADELDDPEFIQKAIALQDRFFKLDLQGMDKMLDKAGV